MGVVIWRRLLGRLSDILWYAVIGTVQQQDAGRLVGVWRGDDIPSEFDGSAQLSITLSILGSGAMKNQQLHQPSI